MGFLPITAKLNPFVGLRPLKINVHNLTYMAEIAMLTRLAYGLVRVWQNHPSKLNDPTLTENNKRQAFWERAFVEIVGTIGTIGFLHLGQDLTAKLLERKQVIPEIKAVPGVVRPYEANVANKAMQKVFGENSQGLIKRILYGHEAEPGKMMKASLSSFRKQLIDTMGPTSGERLFQKVRGQVDGFAFRMNRNASLTVIGGVLAGALLGGAAIQWINDRMVGPAIRKTLNKIHGMKPEIQAKAPNIAEPIPVPSPPQVHSAPTTSQLSEVSSAPSIPVAPAQPASLNGPVVNQTQTPTAQPINFLPVMAQRVSPPGDVPVPRQTPVPLPQQTTPMLMGTNQHASQPPGSTIVSQPKLPVSPVRMTSMPMGGFQ